MARRKRLPEPYEASIDVLEADGRGSSNEPRPGVFFGALPGERVRVEVYRRLRGRDQGGVLEVLEAHPGRVEPPCAEFGRCGGCTLQHLASDAQLEHKQRGVAALFEEAGVEVGAWREPLRASTTGYRRRARIGVKWVEKKGEVLVGFREVRDRRFIAGIPRCEVLVASAADLPAALSRTFSTLSVRDALPQVELAAGDDSLVLVLRILRPISPEDQAVLEQFEQTHGVSIYLQPGGLDTVRPLRESSKTTLRYRVGDLTFEFLPTDFVQVHAELNAQMVTAAIEALELSPGDRVLDLFCGIGNFTLPIAARLGADGTVSGAEGDQALVERARGNAARNGLEASFERVDLYGELGATAFLGQQWSKILLDPPRSGGGAVIEQLPALGAERIVYVSCGPASLAVDLARLQSLGYRVDWVRVMDMFPHTSHVEVMTQLSLRSGPAQAPGLSQAAGDASTTA